MAGLALAVNPGLAGAEGVDVAGPAVVAEAIDGDTLRLADGRVLRLAAILAPTGEEPLASTARTALAAAAGRPLLLEFGPRRTDRHGRLVAQAWLAAPDGAKDVWLQALLVGRGLARVAGTADALQPELLRVEAEARAAGRGLWSDPDYRIRSPEDAGAALNRFQIVEGRVHAAVVLRGRGYLNFGADYKTDFTVSFSADALRRLRDGGIAFESLEGVRLRARGWLRSFNGPLIDVTHPAQIEVLE